MLTGKSLSDTVEFRGGPDDGMVLVVSSGHVFDVWHRRDGGTAHRYEETGRVTARGHREAAYRGEVYQVE